MGLGRQVLLDAIETLVSVSARAGGRLVIVDSYDDAAVTWYQKLGFTSFGDATDGPNRHPGLDPGSQHPARMYLRVDRAVESLTPAGSRHARH